MRFSTLTKLEWGCVIENVIPTFLFCHLGCIVANPRSLSFCFPCADSSCRTIKVYPHFYYFPVSHLIGNGILLTINLRQCFFRCTVHFKFKDIKGISSVIQLTDIKITFLQEIYQKSGSTGRKPKILITFLGKCVE